MKKFQRLIGNAFVVIGTMVTVYNGLNFAHGNSVAIKYGLAEKVAYFYTTDTRIWITIGVALLLIGLFLKDKK